MDEHQGSAKNNGPPVGRFYRELRALAGYHLARERPDHTLQPTALAHEVYLRLAGQPAVAGHDRTQFMSIASEMVRRILVDHARKRGAAKRGGGAFRVEFDELRIPEAGEEPADLLDVDEALIELARLSARQARIVELRFFGGLSLDEVAQSLGVSRGTVKGDWRVARAWLRARLTQ